MHITPAGRRFVRGGEEGMLQQGTTGDRILEIVRAGPDCTLEEVTPQLPELYWAEYFSKWIV